MQRRVLYSDHRGALRLLLQVCTERSWRVLGVVVDEHPRVGGIDELLDRDDHDGVVAVSLTLDGTDLSQSTAALADVPGVLRVEDDIDEESE